MNDIRKIITERLDNARLDYGNSTRVPQLELKGQIEAYQDCLNLIPAPRTEQEILNDFEKLGWKIVVNNSLKLRLSINSFTELDIDKLEETYLYKCYLTMQEHKLLNELFEVWGW